MSRKFKTCYLHIGTSKTGTSSIQGCFYRNRKLLEAGGYLYPGNAANHFFLKSVFADAPEKMRLHVQTGRTSKPAIAHYHHLQMTKLQREIDNTAADNIVFSSENYSSLVRSEVARMGEFLDGIAETVRVICYLRHPLDHARSLAQQNIKAGDRRLVSDAFAGFFRPSMCLPPFVNTFGRDKVRVVAFDRSRLHQADIVADFARQIEMPAQLFDSLIKVPDRNESVGYEGLLIADSLTRQFPKRKNGGWNQERAQAINLSGIGGRRFTLSDETVEKIMHQAVPETAYLSETFDLELRSPESTPVIVDDTPLWSPHVTDSIARKINDYALQVQHKNSVIAFKDGELARLSGNGEDALDRYTEALLLNVQNFKALEALVRLMRDRGNLAEAAAMARKHVRGQLNNKRLTKLLNALLEELGVAPPEGNIND